MSTWFLCKVSYLKRLEDGAVKKASESYLFDALSFTEAEARLYEEISSEIAEFTVSSIGKTKYTSVHFFNDATSWYRVKIVFSSVDADSGKEKKINELVLVKADDLRDAYDKAVEKLGQIQLSAEITDISKTPILEVFPYRATDEHAPEGFVHLNADQAN